MDYVGTPVYESGAIEDYNEFWYLFTEDNLSDKLKA